MAPKAAKQEAPAPEQPVEIGTGQPDPRVYVTVAPAVDTDDEETWYVTLYPFQTQAEAEAFARASYRTFGTSELVLKGRDGQIRDRDSWPRASDPPGTRGVGEPAVVPVPFGFEPDADGSTPIASAVRQAVAAVRSGRNPDAVVDALLARIRQDTERGPVDATRAAERSPE